METPRMGLRLAEQDPDARALLEHAGRLAGVDPFRLLSRGGPDLGRTEVLQPLLTAVSLAALAALRRAVAPATDPVLVAGHSLGELAAWAATGAVGVEEAVTLAAERGRLMAREAALHPGGMVALTGTRDRVERALEVARGLGAVELAAHNAPLEWTVSGERRALVWLEARCGARRISTSGPWHSSAMANAEAELRSRLEHAGPGVRGGANGRPPARFVSNRTGEETPPEAVPAAIAGQLTRPVLWSGSLATLARAGATDFVCLGPSRVLGALVRRNLGERARAHAIEEPGHIDRLCEELDHAAT
jgi:[acyl-carrier-protein] S-malonyltransferase